MVGFVSVRFSRYIFGSFVWVFAFCLSVHVRTLNGLEDPHPLTAMRLLPWVLRPVLAVQDPQ